MYLSTQVQVKVNDIYVYCIFTGIYNITFMNNDKKSQSINN